MPDSDGPGGWFLSHEPPSLSSFIQFHSHFRTMAACKRACTRFGDSQKTFCSIHLTTTTFSSVRRRSIVREKAIDFFDDLHPHSGRSNPAAPCRGPEKASNLPLLAVLLSSINFLTCPGLFPCYFLFLFGFATFVRGIFESAGPGLRDLLGALTSKIKQPLPITLGERSSASASPIPFAFPACRTNRHNPLNFWSNFFHYLSGSLFSESVPL